MENHEKPLPAPVAFQTSGGPSAGHCLSSPVSFETPSRFGPRHCGQFALDWASACWTNSNKATVASANILTFILFSFVCENAIDPGRHEELVHLRRGLEVEHQAAAERSQNKPQIEQRIR